MRLCMAAAFNWEAETCGSLWAPSYVHGLSQLARNLRQFGEWRFALAQAQLAGPLQASAPETLAQTVGEPPASLRVALGGQSPVRRQPIPATIDRRRQRVDALTARRREAQHFYRSFVRLGQAERTFHIGPGAGGAGAHVGLGDDHQMGNLDNAGLHELQAIAGAGLHAEDHRIGAISDIGLRLADPDGLQQRSEEHTSEL